MVVRKEFGGVFRLFGSLALVFTVCWLCFFGAVVERARVVSKLGSNC